MFFKKRSENSEIIELGRFAGKHLAFAASVLSADNQIIPFAECLTKTFFRGSSYYKQTFVTERFEDGVHIAQAWFENPPHNGIKQVAFCFDGYLTKDDVKAEAIFVVARTENPAISFQVALKYTKNENQIYFFEEPIVLFYEENSQFEPLAAEVKQAVYAGRRDLGISQHEIPKWGGSRTIF